MNRSQYAVAQFENGIISVVPVKWIFKSDDNLFCHWTASRQRLMSNEMPNPNWPVWPIVRIMARRDTYEMAEALSDSFSSDVMLSDIPDKERLFTLSDSRIKRRTKRFYDEPGNDDAEKGNMMSNRLKQSGKMNESPIRNLPDPPVFRECSMSKRLKTSTPKSKSMKEKLSKCKLTAESHIGATPEVLNTYTSDTELDSENTSKSSINNLGHVVDESANHNASTDYHNPIPELQDANAMVSNHDPFSSELLEVDASVINVNHISADLPDADSYVVNERNPIIASSSSFLQSTCRLNQAHSRSYELPIPNNPTDACTTSKSIQLSVCESDILAISSVRADSLSSCSETCVARTRTKQSTSAPDIMLRILQISEETKTIALENRRNIEMLKLALSSRTDDSATDDSVLQLLERPLEDTEELTAFNAELENRMKYRKIVLYLSDLPGKDVADKTRAVLKRLVSDKAQMLFNYEGRGQKCKLSIKSFPRILSAVYDAVRRNWHSPERVDHKTVRAAVCECLKHAAQREARRLVRLQKQAAIFSEFGHVENVDD